MLSLIFRSLFWRHMLKRLLIACWIMWNNQENKALHKRSYIEETKQIENNEESLKKANNINEFLKLNAEVMQKEIVEPLIQKPINTITKQTVAWITKYQRFSDFLKRIAMYIIFFWLIDKDSLKQEISNNLTPTKWQKKIDNKEENNNNDVQTLKEQLLNSSQSNQEKEKIVDWNIKEKKKSWIFNFLALWWREMLWKNNDY